MNTTTDDFWLYSCSLSLIHPQQNNSNFFRILLATNSLTFLCVCLLLHFVSLTCVSGTISVLEPADDVAADALEALPAVLRGKAGCFGLRLLCGTSSGLPRLENCFLGLGALAWQGLNRLWLDRFSSSDGLGLGRHHWFTLLLDGLGGLGGGGLGLGGQEGHLGIFRVFLAHLWAVDFGSLAGMAQFPHVPHYLGEVVARVEVVGAAQVGLALEVAVVGASWGLALARTFAGDTQTSIVPGSRHHHGTGVFGLSAESDGLIPDAALLLLLLLLDVVTAVVGLSI